MRVLDDHSLELILSICCFKDNNLFFRVEKLPASLSTP